MKETLADWGMFCFFDIYCCCF